MKGFPLMQFFKSFFKKQVDHAYLDTLNLLANVVEGKDPYTAGHTWRVSQYAIAIADQLGWNQDGLASIQLAAYFHDLGKIALEDRILRKTGTLTDEEFEQVKVHPLEGRRLLQGIELLRPTLNAIYSHHERYDGSGYPEGLKGREIPAEGRVIAVADVFDGLTSNRPYRRPMQAEEALDYLKTKRGVLFDPDITDSLISSWEKGRLKNTILHSEGHIPLLECPTHGPTIAVGRKASEGSEALCPVCKTRFVLVKAKEGWQVRMI